MSEEQKAALWAETATAADLITTARDVMRRQGEYKNEYGFVALESLLDDLRSAKNILSGSVSGQWDWKPEAQRWLDRYNYGG